MTKKEEWFILIVFTTGDSTSTTEVGPFTNKNLACNTTKRMVDNDSSRTHGGATIFQKDDTNNEDKS